VVGTVGSVPNSNAAGTVTVHFGTAVPHSRVINVQIKIGSSLLHYVDILGVLKFAVHIYGVAKRRPLPSSPVTKLSFTTVYTVV